MYGLFSQTAFLRNTDWSKKIELCNQNYVDISCHIITSSSATMQIRDAFWLYVTNTLDIQFVCELNVYEEETFLRVLLDKTPIFQMDNDAYRTFMLGATRFIKLPVATYYT
jgi:hypothetical protein